MMRAKQLLRAGVLIAFAILAAGCGAPIIAETATGSVDQPVESTATTDIQESNAERVDPVGEGSNSTVPGMTTAAAPTLEYSPAWIEWQELKPHLDDDSLESIRIINNYLLDNPNNNSTPMGALCWAFYELSRSNMMGVMRWLLDDYMIPDLMDEYGVTSEQVGDPGPEATEAFLDLVSGDVGSVGSINDGTGDRTALPGDGGKGSAGSTGEADNGKDGDFYLEYIRLEHEFAGNGTAWANALRAVASPEMVAAFQAGEGLPPNVRVYAEALIAFAKERVGRELDVSAETDDIDFMETWFPGVVAFVEAANYHQDCKRVWIDDITSTVESSSAPTTTTTTIPLASTTTTIQQTVEDTSPSTTSLTAPPSVTTTRPLADDAVPSSSRPTVPVSATTTMPQVEDPSPSTTTTTSAPAVDDDSVTTTQPSVELPVSTTLPQVEDTSSSTTTTTPVLPVDGSVATPTTLPFGAGDPPSDDSGGSGLLEEEGTGG